MFCSHCGTELPARAAACPNCGSPIPPAVKLPDNRNLLEFFLLSCVTFGIYGIVVLSQISREINTVASKYDGKETMHYCWAVFLFAPLTFGLFYLVWFHMLSARISDELKRRNIDYEFGAKTFWLWGVLGAFIIAGPFVYLDKLLNSMNLLAADYNAKG